MNSLRIFYVQLVGSLFHDFDFNGLELEERFEKSEEKVVDSILEAFYVQDDN